MDLENSFGFEDSDILTSEPVIASTEQQDEIIINTDVLNQDTEEVLVIPNQKGYVKSQIRDNKLIQLRDELNNLLEASYETACLDVVIKLTTLLQAVNNYTYVTQGEMDSKSVSFILKEFLTTIKRQLYGTQNPGDNYITRDGLYGLMRIIDNISAQDINKVMIEESLLHELPEHLGITKLEGLKVFGIDVDVLLNLENYPFDTVKNNLKNYIDFLESAQKTLKEKLSYSDSSKLQLDKKHKYYVDMVKMLFRLEFVDEDGKPKSKGTLQNIHIIKTLLLYIDKMLDDNISDEIKYDLEKSINQYVRAIYRVSSIVKLPRNSVKQLYKIKNQKQMVVGDDLTTPETFSSFTEELMEISSPVDITVTLIYFSLIKFIKKESYRKKICSDFLEIGKNLSPDFVLDSIINLTVFDSTYVNDTDTAYNILVDRLNDLYKMLYYSEIDGYVPDITQNIRSMLTYSELDMVGFLIEMYFSRDLYKKYLMQVNNVIKSVLEPSVGESGVLIEDYRKLYSVIRKPLIVYDDKQHILSYIPVGNFRHYNASTEMAEEVSLANFCFDNPTQSNQDVTELILSQDDSSDKIIYKTNSHFAWLVSNLTLVNRSHYINSVRSDEVSYKKLFSISVMGSDVVEKEHQITEMTCYSDEELRAIINDYTGMYYLSLPGSVIAEKENILLSLRPNDIIYVNDYSNGVQPVFVKGTLQGNYYMVYTETSVGKTRLRKIIDLLPTNFLRMPNTRSEEDSGRINFVTGANKYLISIPNEDYDTGKVYLNSRKVLLDILLKYRNLYPNAINTPLTNNYIFEMHKEAIVKEYFTNLSLIINLLIEEEIIPFIEQIRQNSYLNLVVNAILKGNADKFKITGSTKFDLSVKGTTFEELLNFIILLQKNKRLSMVYSGNVDDTLDITLKPNSQLRLTSSVEVDSINLSERNIDYGLLTLEDLWGYSFIQSSDKSASTRTNKFVFKTDKNDRIKLIVEDYDVDDTRKKTVLSVLTLRMLYSIYEMRNTLVKPQQSELVGVLPKSNTKAITVNSESKAKEKTYEKLGDYLTTTLKIGDTGFMRDENEELINWFSKSLNVNENVFTTQWLNSYRNYFKLILSDLPQPKKAGFAKKFAGKNISIDYLMNAYIKCLSEMTSRYTSDMFNPVEIHNQLFFNSIKQDSDTVQIQTKSGFDNINLYEVCVTTGTDINIADILLYCLKVKDVQTEKASTTLGELLIKLGVEMVTDFKYPNLKLSDEALSILNRVCTRILLTRNITSNNCIQFLYTFLETVTLEDLTDFNDISANNLLYSAGLPSMEQSFDSNDIDEYVNNFPFEDVTFSIDLYKKLDAGKCKITHVRDKVLWHQFFSDRHFLKGILDNIPPDALAEKMLQIVDGMLNNLGDLSLTDMKSNGIYEHLQYYKERLNLTDEKIGGITKQFLMRASSVVTNPIEIVLLQYELIDRLHIIPEKVAKIMTNTVLSDLQSGSDLAVYELRELENRVEDTITAKEFYLQLNPYWTVTDSITAIEDFVEVNNRIKNLYLNSQSRRQAEDKERVKSQKLFELSLDKHSPHSKKNFGDMINYNLLGFDELISDNWDTPEKHPAKYSLRRMFREYPRMLDDYNEYYDSNSPMTVSQIETLIENNGSVIPILPELRVKEINGYEHRVFNKRPLKKEFYDKATYVVNNSLNKSVIELEVFDMFEIYYIMLIKEKKNRERLQNEINNAVPDALAFYLDKRYEDLKAKDLLEGNFDEDRYPLGKEYKKYTELMSTVHKAFSTDQAIRLLISAIKEYNEGINFSSENEEENILFMHKMYAIIIRFFVENNLLVFGGKPIITKSDVQSEDINKLFNSYRSMIDSDYITMLHVIEIQSSIEVNNEKERLKKICNEYSINPSLAQSTMAKTDLGELSRIEKKLSSEGKVFNLDNVVNTVINPYGDLLFKLPRAILNSVIRTKITVSKGLEKTVEKNRILDENNNPVIPYEMTLV